MQRQRGKIYSIVIMDIQEKNSNAEYMDQRVKLEDLIRDLVPPELSMSDIPNLGWLLGKLGKGKGFPNGLDYARELAKGGHVEFVASMIDNVRFPVEEDCEVLITALKVRNELEASNLEIVANNKNFISRIEEISEKAKQVS